MKQIKDGEMLRAALREGGLGSIFGDGSERELKLYRADKGDLLCRSGEAMTRLCFLIEGRLKVYTTLSNGKSLLLRFMNPPALIGDLEYVTGSPAGATAELVTEGLILTADYETLYAGYHDNPAFLRHLLGQLGHKLETLSNSTSVNQLNGLEQRFTNYLVSAMMMDGENGFAAEIRSPKLADIAELLGTSYRHLNRIIAALAADGIIERRRGSLFVTDIARLKERSSEDIYK